MRSFNTKRATPNLESLERREVPAGNVTAKLALGTLSVTGDNLGNTVKIIRTEPGRVDVAGVGNTKINGHLGLIVSYKLTADLRINMRGGQDAVSLVSAPFPSRGGYIDVPGDLSVQLGTEDDLVMMNGVTVRGNAHIETGSGKDRTLLTHVRVGRDLTVLDDAFRKGLSERVDLADVVVGESTGRGILTLRLTEGTDVVNLNQVFVKEFDIEMGGGADVLSMVETSWDATRKQKVLSGSGRDTINLSNNGVFDPVFRPVDPPLTGWEVITRKK